MQVSEKDFKKINRKFQKAIDKNNAKQIAAYSTMIQAMSLSRIAGVLETKVKVDKTNFIAGFVRKI
jgi:hypothetical protein